MVTRIPYLQIFAPSGRDIVPGLGSAFLGVTINDQEGEESDDCTITVADKAPFNTLPPKGTKYLVKAGWRGDSGSIGGIYAFESAHKSGDPEEGKTIDLVCRAADFIDKMKQGGSQHYDEEGGFGTIGKIFESLAKEGGAVLAIDPVIAAIKIPYRLRWNQSAIDFASELAEEFGAVLKPQMGKLVVRPRGAGTSASGSALASLKINLDLSYGYDFDIDPRPQHKEVSSPWFDADEGRVKEAVEAAQGQFARALLMHPAATKDEASAIAKATGKAMNQMSGTGLIELAGSANALAGAPANITGGGPDIDDLSWSIESASHTITPDGGWSVSVGVQTANKAE